MYDACFSLWYIYSSTHLSNRQDARVEPTNMPPDHLKYIVSAVVALSSYTHATSTNRKVERSVRVRSPDIVTSNWAELTKSSGRSHKGYGSATTIAALGGVGVSLQVEFGGQKFQLLVDTGSSDFWVPTQNFTCVGTDYGQKNPTQADCAFGPLYKQAPGFEQIPDRNFNLTYAGLGAITGVPGYDNVTVAGITVPHAHVNLVNEAFWTGDNVTSGVIGLAYPYLTSQYAGTNPDNDVQGKQIPYAPFFTSMYTNTNVPPVFSLALERKSGSYGLLAGGKIAFGGLPPVNYTGGFAQSQIIKHKVIPFYPEGNTHFQEYTIVPDGFVFPGAGKLRPMTNQANNDTLQENKRSFVGTDFPMFIDSGTPLLYIPKQLAESVNAAYSPPAKYNKTYEAYTVDCKATPPSFGVVIGGKTFYLNPEDMFGGPLGDGTCLGGITWTLIPSTTSRVPPFNILGVTFLKSVLAVFDVGGSEMRIASRENY